MSLSQEPAFSMLKDQFVCGVRDISNQRYAGVSGKHMPNGNAIDTTNGAGPHNIQMFIMTPDGVVLHCLPGYWHAVDLATELKFAGELNAVWQDPNLTREQKDEKFRQMQLGHIHQHSKAMAKRSQLQGFDAQYEIKNRYWQTDTIANRSLIDPGTMKPYPGAMKTTDVIMHERMAARPFLPYNKFDTAKFADYGKQKYDKQEDYRDANGQVIPGAAKDEPLLGNDPKAHPVKTASKQVAKTTLRVGVRTLLRYGIQAAIR